MTAAAAAAAGAGREPSLRARPGRDLRLNRDRRAVTDSLLGAVAAALRVI
jgi:hypothetical protein